MNGEKIKALLCELVKELTMGRVCLGECKKECKKECCKK